MNKPYLFSKPKNKELELFINHALQEDIGSGDHTTLSTIPASATNKASLVMKEDGIVAGIELAKKIFYAVDKKLKMETFKQDGVWAKKGEILFTIKGKARSILTAERVVLNCMQRMSGIATLTNKFVAQAKTSKTKILDTRKTTPGMRAIEKWAVRIGGGYNHRFGLFDMILIKNNHIDFAGGIQSAIHSAHKYLKQKKLKLQIEIEARNIQEIKEILKTGGVDRILLDNFSIPEIQNALLLINEEYETEISGGITLENVNKYATCGANYISAGALTHSAKSIDMSLTANIT